MPGGSSPDPEVPGCPAPVPQTGHACWKPCPPRNSGHRALWPSPHSDPWQPFPGAGAGAEVIRPAGRLLLGWGEGRSPQWPVLKIGLWAGIPGQPPWGQCRGGALDPQRTCSLGHLPELSVQHVSLTLADLRQPVSTQGLTGVPSRSWEEIPPQSHFSDGETEGQRSLGSLGSHLGTAGRV